MSETTGMAVATTVEVVILIFVLGMLAKSLATDWRNQLVRECTSQLPGLERHLVELQHEGRQLAAKLDRLDEKSVRQTAEIRRIHDYLIEPSQPPR